LWSHDWIDDTQRSARGKAAVAAICDRRNYATLMERRYSSTRNRMMTANAGKQFPNYIENTIHGRFHRLEVSIVACTADS
jgi:hypothetical protein